MNAEWTSHARELLLRWQTGGAGWSYRPESGCSAEPTALAILGLAASDVAEAQPVVHKAAVWLADRQQRDGALGVSESVPAPHWPTALAVLAWGADGGFERQRRLSVDWLLEQQGNTAALSSGTPFGHDSTIPGWPWVAGTQSWVEPTAYAVLALCREGQAAHRRVAEGRRLIRDRVIRTGGWNYGNSQVFGADLRPQPAPTGLALLALAGDEDADAPCIRQSCAYLEAALPGTRAAQSLCWGLLGLSAWGRLPSEAGHWLEDALPKAQRRTGATMQIACLLLAAGERTLELLGLERVIEQAPP